MALPHPDGRPFETTPAAVLPERINLSPLVPLLELALESLAGDVARQVIQDHHVAHTLELGPHVALGLLVTGLVRPTEASE